MKKLFLFVCLFLLTATYSSFAQTNEAKDELYGKIAKLTQTKKDSDQDKAFQLSKEFLTKFGSDNDEKTQKIKEFVESYRITLLNRKLNENKTAEAMAMGKEILAQEPENTYVTMSLANAGYNALIKNKDKSFSADAVQYANKTLELLEQGKEPKTYEPFKDKAEITALMHYIIGNFSVDNDLDKAAENFYQAVQYDSKIKTTSYPYYIIGFYYDKKYEKAAKEFQTKYGSQETETADMKADNAKLEKLLRRMMDAYARAVKYAEPTNPSGKAWRQRFIEVYKFVNQGDQGMDTFLNDVTNSPLPDPKTI